jgi:hypothetical protein
MAEMSLLRRFMWPVCVDGYTVERERREPLKLGQRRSSVTNRPGAASIAAKSANFRQLPVLEKGAIYRAFAECKTVRDAVNFANQYGLPYSGKGYPWILFQNAIRTVHDLVAAGDLKDWRLLSSWLERVGKDSPFGEGGFGRLGIVYDWSPGEERPTLRLRAGTLMSAMVFQCLEDFAGGTLRKQCELPGCNVWFAYGPGTGHRDGRLYCCDAHKYAARELKRSKARGAAR